MLELIEGYQVACRVVERFAEFDLLSKLGLSICTNGEQIQIRCFTVVNVFKLITLDPTISNISHQKIKR